MAGRRNGAENHWGEVSTRTIDDSKNELVQIALALHEHPETNYQEYYAAKLLADTLEQKGFLVERGVGGVETAFRATIEGGAGEGPTVAILAEYDALPEIGHGCGHNLIAMTAVGAGLGVQAALPMLPGRVMVIGTPAEEGGGGKVRLLKAGVFDGVQVGLKSHPGSNRTSVPLEVPLDESWRLAMVGFRYIFHGKAAHAATMPEEGINALNAVIHLFTGIDAMRQHLRDDVRIHGVITHGGKAANVVPDFAAANFMLRSRDHLYLRDEVVPKVAQIAEGAAKMTGARLEIEPLYPFYENVRPNNELARLVIANARKVGMELDDKALSVRRSTASTDSGNVSQVLPFCNISFAISKTPVAGHSLALTDAARSEFALDSALNVAKVLALSTCDLLTNHELVEAARHEFEERGRLSRRAS
jgi:amidohydrolase